MKREGADDRLERTVPERDVQSSRRARPPPIPRGSSPGNPSSGTRAGEGGSRKPTESNAATRLDPPIVALPGVERARSRYGHARAYRVDGVEFVPFPGKVEIDVRLTRRVLRVGLAQVSGNPRIRLRGKASDWSPCAFPARRISAPPLETSFGTGCQFCRSASMALPPQGASPARPRHGGLPGHFSTRTCTSTLDHAFALVQGSPS